MTSAPHRSADDAARDDPDVALDAQADDLDDLDETLLRRRRVVRAAEPDRPLPPEIDAETGSTVVVRRESRRRAELAAKDLDVDLDVTIAGSGIPALPAAVAGDMPAPLGRHARTPAAVDPSYGVRRSEPALASRTPPSAHPLQAPVDTAAGEALRVRRARRHAIITVAATTVVMVVAIALLVVLVVAR